MNRPRRGGDISAIFVHAGAGFHSHHNERAHLETCENAAKVAMAMLKNGGTAVDAVEIAIMLLEDAEITNAGYGSNLTIDGSVECDATIVDHKGRSGAVGAVAQVKNPISLARVVLEASTKPLSLQRVPPNFLVGSGAVDFAYEHGLVVLPHDGLISVAAKERWNRWRHDLEDAAERERQQSPTRYSHKAYVRQPVPVHPAQLLATPCSIGPSSLASSPLASHPTSNYVPADNIRDRTSAQEAQGLTPPADQNSEYSDSSRAKGGGYIDGAFPETGNTSGALKGSALRDSSSASNVNLSEHPAVPPETGHSSMDIDPPGEPNQHHTDADHITDTVGAIAVDRYGNIAAGSSSGGIGMKHRGRVGPAALVGIGTNIIPADPNDPEKTFVATVTSGTGEHIATTMAASTCALRVYYSQRKCEDGAFEYVSEDEAIREMIKSDFMDHPGVRGSLCQGAIGVMAVKKTVDGIFLFFGHNTDSFALASMSSEDKKPVSVMSRSSGNGGIAQGGRACRHKRYKARDFTAGTDQRNM
ncbi:hypothetical protein AWENTII_008028 [Aspergillus wentii]